MRVPLTSVANFLVYSMTLDTRKDLAMSLPLPVKTPAAENDVEFIDLHFDHSLFCQPTPEQRPASEEWQETAMVAFPSIQIEMSL